MVSRVAALPFGHHHALALRTHQNFVFGLFEILHFHQTRIAPGGHQSSFVAQIGQVGAGHTGCATGDHTGVHVLGDGHLAHVHIQNLLATTNIGQGHIHLAVKATRAEQCSIQNVRTVGRSDHDDADVGLKTIHLHQHLVQGLLALVVSAAQTGATLATDRVNFIDKDDAGRILFGVVKHIAHTGCADAHEHFYEV